MNRQFGRAVFRLQMADPLLVLERLASAPLEPERQRLVAGLIKADAVGPNP